MTPTERAECIYQARRAATRRRLVDVDHIDEFDAEHRVARWEGDAATSGVGRYSAEFWADGGVWIGQERAAERKAGRR